MSILEIELKSLSERFVDKIKDHDGTIYLVDGNGKRKFKIERIKTTSGSSTGKSSSSKLSSRSSGSGSSSRSGGNTSRSSTSRTGSGKSSSSGKSRKGENPLDSITRYVNRLPQ